jgi:pSer/pThr/pTyr-binding forkhead associated (FHA) protein
MASHHSQDRTAAVARSLAQQLLVEGQQELVGPALIVANGPQDGERFELDDPPATLIVGRATECDITLVDSEVSRHHLELKITAEGVLAHDLGGKNPLLVNDRETAQHRLHDRDELLLGSTTLIFDDPVEAYLLELAKRPEGATDRMLPVSLKGDTPSPKSTRREKIGGLQATRPRERDRRSAHGERRIAKDTIAPNSTGGSDELSPAQAESGADHKVISPEAASHPAADSAPGPGLRDLQHRSFPGGSAGSEVAILLVGALVLAACVAALVWIFR